LREACPAVLDYPPRDDLEALEERLGLSAAVRLDDADHDVDALAAALAGRLEHGERLADAGRGADEDLETAPLLLRGGLQERLGRRPVVSVRTAAHDGGAPGRSLSPGVREVQQRAPEPAIRATSARPTRGSGGGRSRGARRARRAAGPGCSGRRARSPRR